mgnify:CR=1 FL=1
MKNCRLELVALELDTTLDVPPRLLRLDAELLEGVGGMRFVAASLRCGSSVTASVLGVAYSLVNNKYMPIIYIGSWSEYGKIK